MAASLNAPNASRISPMLIVQGIADGAGDNVAVDAFFGTAAPPAGATRRAMILMVGSWLALVLRRGQWPHRRR